MKAAQPQRSFLELPEIAALFQAAAELESERRGLDWAQVRAIRESTDPAVRLARRYGVSDTLIRKIRAGELWTERPERRRNDIPRLAVVATLVLAGPRISELCLLEGRHVDLARRQIRMPRHTLRRTFASLLAEVGVRTRRATYLLGHTDPKLTTRVYQQVLDMAANGDERCENVLGCSIDEAFARLSGRAVSGPKPDPASSGFARGGEITASEERKSGV